MDIEKGKGKKFKQVKKLLHSLSLPRGQTKFAASTGGFVLKSKSCSHSLAGKVSLKDDTRKMKRQVAPGGCFAVYVGPEKQRFVVKTEYSNHPLFKLLLDDAEMEYGFSSQGPISLPCDVDLFYKVLAEMDCSHEIHSRIGFGYGKCSPFNPTRRLGKSIMAKGYASYGLLTLSRSIRMNL